jgi:ribosomal protein L20A (L18A)
MKQKYLVEMHYEVYFETEVEAESEDEAEDIAFDEIAGRKDLPQGCENWVAEHVTVVEEEDEE